MKNVKALQGKVDQSGLAALSVVMVLFFIMAMVAAYTNRNLVFEHRVASNSYRSEQALISADGGVDWTLQLLNSGRIGTDCLPSAAAGDPSARSRYLTRNANGSYGAVLSNTGASPLFLSCVLRDGQPICVCPSQAVPDPSPHAVRNWSLTDPGSAFRVNLLPPGDGSKPGAIVASVRGCGTPGRGATSCADATDNPDADGIALVRQTIGLVRALPSPPIAALTTGRNVVLNGSALRVSNTDTATGATVHTGGTVDPGTGNFFAGPAGSGHDGRIVGDSGLAALTPSESAMFGANDAFFRSMFGMEPATYRRQPGLVRFDCTAAACSATDLRAALDRYPGQPLWFEGDLALTSAPSAASLGNSTDPAMVVVTRRLTVDAALDLRGFFYAGEALWGGAAAAATLQGALVTVHDFVADATASLSYDAAVLRDIQMFYGSFVKAPGGWNRPDQARN